MIKKLLKSLLDSLQNKPEDNIEAFNKHLVETARDPIIPEIDEETHKKNELSQKIFDVVKGDLERYPPHEWIPTAHSNPWSPYMTYTHPCLTYTLVCRYRDLYPDGHWAIFPEDANLTMNYEHDKELYKLFMTPINIHRNKMAEEIKNKILEEFLDDSKRIICKDDE